MHITLHSLKDTEKFAQMLAIFLKSGDVVELRGDLGAGKTAIARGIITALADIGTEVTSPTFNIVQLYDTPEFTIWHFDLYRLKSPGELVEIGLDEAINGGVSLIEWPEIAHGFLPEEKLVINLSCGKNEERLLKIEGYGRWKEWINGKNF